MFVFIIYLYIYVYVYIYHYICAIYLYIQGVPELFEQNVTKCSLQLYKHIEPHKGMSESV